MTHADIPERAALGAQIVAELRKLDAPFAFKGRSWSLMADRDGYCEIEPETGYPANQSPSHRGSCLNLLFDYSKPPAAR